MLAAIPAGFASSRKCLNHRLQLGHAEFLLVDEEQFVRLDPVWLKIRLPLSR